LDQYTGWYNIKEETFVTDVEAELCEYKDPSSGQPFKRVQEASYFFKMSKYHDELVDYIECNHNFIRPDSHRNAILARLRSDKLRDLSISRTTFDHGVPVPTGFEEKHVMYVWFDALANYLTGVDALGVNNNDDKDVNNKSGDNNATTKSSSLASLWPADVHIIGKDILWFHAVIWPCILMSAKLPLPKTIFAHGFVNDSEGKKMSKSVGNVVDPHDMLDIFDVDSFRWYLCREAPYGGELSFSEASMRDMHNADLVKTLGNLVQRVTKLCEKYCCGVIPDVDPGPSDCIIDFEKVRANYVSEMTSYALESGANIAIQACRDVNGYLTREEPWKLVGDIYADKRRAVVRATLEAVYAVSHLLLPFIPKGASEIFTKMNTPPRSLWDVDSNLRNNLLIGTKIDVGEILYEINKSEAEKELSKAEASSKKKESYEEAQRLKKEKKAREVAASKARLDGDAGGAGGDDQPEFTKIDIRVGQIIKVWNHPEADKLFCEEIDVGEESGPRQIASGLREHYTLEEMLNRKVLVVCNLKAAKIVGFTSNGMVLAAKSTDGKRVELISPPANALIGERVYIDGLCGEPQSSAQVKKKKIWESVAKDLITGENGVATWDGKEILTSAGACSAVSLVGAPIS
jgi:methionyl-tRNA synthetase